MSMQPYNYWSAVCQQSHFRRLTFYLIDPRASLIERLIKAFLGDDLLSGSEEKD